DAMLPLIELHIGLGAPYAGGVRFCANQGLAVEIELDGRAGIARAGELHLAVVGTLILIVDDLESDGRLGWAFLRRSSAWCGLRRRRRPLGRRIGKLLRGLGRFGRYAGRGLALGGRHALLWRGPDWRSGRLLRRLAHVFRGPRHRSDLLLGIADRDRDALLRGERARAVRRNRPQRERVIPRRELLVEDDAPLALSVGRALGDLGAAAFDFDLPSRTRAAGKHPLTGRLDEHHVEARHDHRFTRRSARGFGGRGRLRLRYGGFGCDRSGGGCRRCRATANRLAPLTELKRPGLPVKVNARDAKDDHGENCSN